MTLIAERTETAVDLALTVDQGGGVAGLAATVSIRDGATDGSYLDFSDMTFKAAGWITKAAALTDLGGGHYRRALDLTAVTNLPSGGELSLEFTATGAVTAAARESLLLVASFLDIPAQAAADTQAAILSDATPFAGADVAAILADTDSLDTTKITAARAASLDELDAANIPADVDTLLARLTALRAANLDELTAARLSELDAANLPADVAAILSDTNAIKLRVDGELVDVAKFLGLVIGDPVTHTPTTITAGARTWSVGIVGSTITVSRLT